MKTAPDHRAEIARSVAVESSSMRITRHERQDVDRIVRVSLKAVLQEAER
jgi:hypothetical protein